MTSICVFCGSSPGTDPSFVSAAEWVGATLAKQDIELVYGGGGSGMMGAVANGALAEGGQVLGVIPEDLFKREDLHAGLTRLEVVASMHERKARMAASSDGFLALPGGIGTREELFEIWTWTQSGIHAKPCGILNVAGYYDPLRAFLESKVTRGFVRAEHRDVVLVDDDVERLIARVIAHKPAVHERWLTPSQS